MRLPVELARTDIDIADYYAIRLRRLWEGVKQESPAFWWLCVYFFLEYIRPASLYPSIDILPWTQLALIFTLVAAVSDRSVKWVSSPGNILIVLFFITVMLSSVFAFRPSLSWDKIDTVINWVLVYFLFICIVNTEKRFFIYFLLFLLVNFKMSQHGFFSFAARGFAYTHWGVVGAPGWFHDSGDFGIAMIMFSSVAISFALALRKYWGRFKSMIFYFLPLTGMVSIVATSSRGAQLGLVAMGLWFLLKSRKGLKAIMVIAVVGSLLYVLLPEKMFEEYASAGDDRTSQDRLAHWEFGLDVVEDHPVLGIGYENWLSYCDFKNPHGLGYKPWCRLPHNTYVSAAAETGLLGLTLYIAMILFMFILNSKTRANAKKNENDFIYNIAHGLDAGLFGYLIASIFFTVLFYPLFWFQLAMVVALNRISRNDATNKSSPLHN